MTSSSDAGRYILRGHTLQRSPFSRLQWWYRSLPWLLTWHGGRLLVSAVVSLPLPLIICCLQLLLKLGRKGSKHLRVHLVETRRVKVKPELMLYFSQNKFCFQIMLFWSVWILNRSSILKLTVSSQGFRVRIRKFGVKNWLKQNHCRTIRASSTPRKWEAKHKKWGSFPMFFFKHQA